MTTAIQRPYAGEADLQALVDFVAARPVERVTDYPSIADIREMMGVPEIREQTMLWSDGAGRLAGFAILRDQNLAFEVAPWAAGDEVGASIMAWAGGCVLRSGGKSGEGLALHISCRDHYTAQLALLERLGFTREPDYAVHLTRPLNGPIVAPQAPQGFQIRHVAGEHEAEALVALHRAAFGTEQMTVEYWLSMMRVPEYDPQLDLIAIAPDGAFASYATLIINEEENRLTGRCEGYVGSVGTHPSFRRRGLAKAIILAGLARLQARGVEFACSDTGSWNVAMQQTFLSIGFQVDATTSYWIKDLAAGQR